jgi:hypothetical protein
MNLVELVFKRKYLKGMEVLNVVVLPLVNDCVIDRNFRKDIDLIQSDAQLKAQAKTLEV